MQDEWVGSYGDLWGYGGVGNEVSGWGGVAISKGCGGMGMCAG